MFAVGAKNIAITGSSLADRRMAKSAPHLDTVEVTDSNPVSPTIRTRSAKVLSPWRFVVSRPTRVDSYWLGA